MNLEIEDYKEFIKDIKKELEELSDLECQFIEEVMSQALNFCHLDKSLLKSYLK